MSPSSGARAFVVPMLAAAAAAVAPARGAELAVAVLDRAGRPVEAIVDGNAVTLEATLPAPARRATPIAFRLDALGAPLAECTVAAATTSCRAADVSTLGWAWSPAGEPRAARTLAAAPANDAATGGTRPLQVRPRPVVLVHGFLSDHHTWTAWTRPGGFLAALGLRGFAVGDGQAEGRLDTGDLGRLTAPTHTLAQNAAELARYIAGVRRATGAERVDVVAHSMGALVARYYVDRLMPARDVAQLVMLGAPHGGSECSGLAAALGVLAPAALELRPAFVRQVFNRGVTRRHGVPFHGLAGDSIAEGFRAPCTDVPSDGVVSVDSASAIPGAVARLPVLHTDMTRSAPVFERFVRARLQQPPGAFADEAPDVHDAGSGARGGERPQFTQVFTGRVEPGGTAEIEVNLDEVAVASFALFDPSRALDVTVRGASGQVIALSAQAHGLVRVDDPTTLVTLGYGFRNPRPGPWRVTLKAPPRLGSDFALSAQVVGGARLEASAQPVQPARDQAVTVRAVLAHPGQALTDVAMRAVIRRPDGRTETVALRGTGGEREAVWRADQPGLHGIDVVATARAGALRIERSEFLAVDVQP